MERFTVNVVGSARRVRKAGREYLVAPMTLICPGVLNGSQGPLFYPPDEVRRSAKIWNGVPITVNHPKADGQRHVSASDPDVQEAQGIGYLRNSKWTGSKLTADGWLDVERTKTVDERVFDAISNGRQIELSTGLFTENEPAENGSSYGGSIYTHVARNYRADHVAVLPDQVGACSIQDGCGVLVNKEKQTVDDPTTDNQLSQGDLRDRLRGLLQERYGRAADTGVLNDVPSRGPELYVADVFISGRGTPYAIYEDNGKSWHIGFSVDGRNDEVKLSDDAPVEVRRVTSYEPVRNEEIENEQPRDARGRFGSGGGGGGASMAPDTGGMVQGGAGKGDSSKVQTVDDAVEAISGAGYKPIQVKGESRFYDPRRAGKKEAYVTIEGGYTDSKKGIEFVQVNPAASSGKGGPSGAFQSEIRGVVRQQQKDMGLVDNTTTNAVSEKLLEQLQDRFGENVKLVRTAGNSVTYRKGRKLYRLTYAGKGDAARISGGRPVEVTETNAVPGDKLRSQGKGRGLARGKGKGPMGTPVGNNNGHADSRLVLYNMAAAVIRYKKQA